MGMSSIADAATGRTIAKREPVVALVIKRRKGGYPDATTHAAMSETSPTGLFEPVSLPIRGQCDDYGQLIPNPGQVSVDLLLGMAEMPDWNGFQAKAFGVHGSIELKSGNRMFPNDEGPVVLGMAVFHARTWDAMVKASRRTGRDDAVDEVMTAMDRVKALVDAGDRDRGFMNSGLFELGAGALILPDERVDLPELARALSHREGGDLLADVAKEWMTRDAGPLGYGLMDTGAPAGLRPLLEDVWELFAAEKGLHYLGRSYMPSVSIGQYNNSPDVIDIALSEIEGAAVSLVRDSEDWDLDNERNPRNPVVAALARLDALRASLEAILESGPVPVSYDDDGDGDDEDDLEDGAPRP